MEASSRIGFNTMFSEDALRVFGSPPRWEGGPEVDGKGAKEEDDEAMESSSSGCVSALGD